MDKIKRFIECTVPISNCNIKCGYCYVIQEDRRNSKVSELAASPEQIGKAFNKERWGGICYLNLCGYGETLLQKEIVDITYNILRQGHYINITTNGTISDKFDKLLQFPDEYLSRLNFCFSLHYNELVKHNLLQDFISNVKKVRKSESSFIVQLNLCDEYIPVLDEIKDLCIKNFGALPQLALTRNEKTDEISILSDLRFNEYCKLGQDFNSTLFKVTTENFMVKRKEFCYAGDWSFKLDLASGDLRSCYFSKPHQNIYKDPNEKICTKPIGTRCKNPYCVNSSHFMSLGIIPTLAQPTYSQCRNRICDDGSEWIKPTMKSFLDSKLAESNTEYGFIRKGSLLIKNTIKDAPSNIKKRLKIFIGQDNIRKIKGLLRK